MTMKIRTEEQAKAVREWLKSSSKLEEALLLSTAKPGSHRALLSDALSAYEQEKSFKDIVLSEDELAYMKWMCAQSEEPAVRASLSSKELKCSEDYRAYLAAQKPNRELRWEVHRINPTQGQDSFRGAFDDKRLADVLICGLNGEFEVREVK